LNLYGLNLHAARRHTRIDNVNPHFSAGEHMLHDGPDQFDGPRWIATAYPGSTLFRKGAVFVATCLCAATVHAVTVTDPAGDFIASFAGAHSGDLDVLSAFANFDGVTFEIGASVNGLVGTLPSALYVFGFNRGAGTSNFAAIGHPGVVFDAVITMTGTGVTGGRDLLSNTALVLPPGAAHISGASFFIDIPASLLPSAGFAPASYGVNLWPRDNAVAAGNAQISDFAPDNSDLAVSQIAAVPEPETYLLLAPGLFWLGALMRKRKDPRDRCGGGSSRHSTQGRIQC
jgi:hypothetical protein